MKQFVIFLLVGLGGLRAGELLRLEDSAEVMGTTYTLILYGEDQEKLEAAAGAAFDEVRRLDRMLSNYRQDSEWSRVNRGAAHGPVKVSSELFALLEQCLDYSRQSEGAFDISVGPLMRTWGFYRGTGRLPSREEMAEALKAVGYRNIALDPREQTVRFLRSGVELDPGGVGKGYAVDRVVALLKAHGIRSALVSAGSSSIYGLGHPPEEPGWRVEIRHPRDWRQTAAEVVLRDESLSTSGDYEKFFEAGGRLYSHIMDPRTGYPASAGVVSVSVVAPTTLASEVWTKPYFVLGRAWAARHKPKEFRVFLCEERSEIECAWLQ
ncbi:MAG: FAD:protein FMN transferase [Bryobacteraceae bacterium]|nr:FAD:protein FMN transferase [Bryobacteraceae bacterium]